MSSSHRRTTAGPSKEGQSTKKVSKSGPKPSQVPNFAVIIGHESINGVWHYLWVAKWPSSADQTVESCPYAMIPHQYRPMLGNQKLTYWDDIKAYYESAVIVPFLPSHLKCVEFAQPRQDKAYNVIPEYLTPELQPDEGRRNFLLVVGTMKVSDSSGKNCDTRIIWTPTLETWSNVEYCVDKYRLLSLVPNDYRETYKRTLAMQAAKGIANLCKWKTYFSKPFAVPLKEAGPTCRDCNMRFTRPVDLKRHLDSASHAKNIGIDHEKPFKCIAPCTSAYARKDKLQEHQQDCKTMQAQSA